MVCPLSSQRNLGDVHGHQGNVHNQWEMVGDFEDLLLVLGDDSFQLVVAVLPLASIATALRVSKGWRSALDGDASLWRALCAHEWSDKVYVPASLRAMAEGTLASEEQERRALVNAKVSELKNLVRSLRIDDASGLLEKSDYADVILRARRAATEGGTRTQKMLKQPALLVRAGELPSKAALRLSFADARRAALTAEEIVQMTFQVRMRHDGPLADARQFDPWWLGKGCGEARFSLDGRVRFTWPLDPDSADGERLDPFAALGLSFPQGLGWELEAEGRLVRLLFHEPGSDVPQAGPQELVCRHPLQWGWVLYSEGTCWTSFAMPACLGTGESMHCSDPLLREEALCRLPCELEREY